jgi:YfdX protein
MPLVSRGYNGAGVLSEAQSRTSFDAQSQRTHIEQQGRPEVENQRREIEEESKKRLDKEAIAAIEQTQKAVEAIGRGQLEKARAAIDEATAKINNLLARKPANALMPVDSELRVIDIAPHGIQAILEIAQDASRALDEKNYPAARALLHSLMSEIRVRTCNLPLATYPDALKQAARLLDQKDTETSQNRIAGSPQYIDCDRSGHSIAADSSQRSNE